MTVECAHLPLVKDIVSKAMTKLDFQIVTSDDDSAVSNIVDHVQKHGTMDAARISTSMFLYYRTNARIRMIRKCSELQNNGYLNVCVMDTFQHAPLWFMVHKHLIQTEFYTMIMERMKLWIRLIPRDVVFFDVDTRLITNLDTKREREMWRMFYFGELVLFVKNHPKSRVMVVKKNFFDMDVIMKAWNDDAQQLTRIRHPVFKDIDGFATIEDMVRWMNDCEGGAMKYIDDFFESVGIGNSKMYSNDDDVEIEDKENKKMDSVALEECFQTSF